MYLIYAYTDYRKENGSKIVGIYQDRNTAEIEYANCIALFGEEEMLQVEELPADYLVSWGLELLPTAGKVIRKTYIDEIVILILVELPTGK